MRTGWRLKELACVLGIHERRATQAVDPAVEKFARLWIASPTKTMLMLLEKVAELQRVAEPISESEMDALRRFQTGRLDRSELKQSPASSFR